MGFNSGFKGLRIPGLLFVVESGYSIFYLLWAAKETWTSR